MIAQQLLFSYGFLINSDTYPFNVPDVINSVIKISILRSGRPSTRADPLHGASQES